MRRRCFTPIIGIVWTIDDQSIARTFSVRDRNTGSDLLADGGLLGNILDSVDCGDTATVTATAIVMNVSSINRDQQVAAATKFVQDAATQIAELYVKVGSAVSDRDECARRPRERGEPFPQSWFFQRLYCMVTLRKARPTCSTAEIARL